MSHVHGMKQREEANFLKSLGEGLKTQVGVLEDFKRRNMTFLVEIVGAQGLFKADVFGSSDPFVKVWFGDKEIHKTRHISDKYVGCKA